MENITNKFQEALRVNTITIPTNQYIDLPQVILRAISLKRRLHRLWQNTRNPEFKIKMNKQTELVRTKLTNHRQKQWHRTIENLRPNDLKLFKLNRRLIEKTPAAQPLLSPDGLVFEPETKAELFVSELEKQFTCPPGPFATNQLVKDQISILDQPHSRSPITPHEIWNIIKTLPKKKSPGPDKISNTALGLILKRTILHLTKIYNCCLRLEHFPVAVETRQCSDDSQGN